MPIEGIIGLIKILFRAYQENNPNVRKSFFLLPTSAAILALALILEKLAYIPRELASTVLGIAGIIFLTGTTAIAGYQIAVEDKRQEAILSQKQAQVLAEPEKIRLAWDLAQEKLAQYVDKNLRQIQAIFTLCCIVMLAGFGLIVCGAVMIFRDPSHLQPSILSAVSGILISFLGGSFLFLYRSTMSQAKDYVAMLDRINAVGMSLQVVDGISDQNSSKRDETKAQIAKELLALYREA